MSTWGPQTLSHGLYRSFHVNVMCHVTAFFVGVVKQLSKEIIPPEDVFPQNELWPGSYFTSGKKHNKE